MAYYRSKSSCSHSCPLVRFSFWHLVHSDSTALKRSSWSLNSHLSNLEYQINFWRCSVSCWALSFHFEHHLPMRGLTRINVQETLIMPGFYRYQEGKKLWTTIMYSSRHLAQLVCSCSHNITSTASERDHRSGCMSMLKNRILNPSSRRRQWLIL